MRGRVSLGGACEMLVRLSKWHTGGRVGPQGVGRVGMEGEGEVVLHIVAMGRQRRGSLNGVRGRRWTSRAGESMRVGEAVRGAGDGFPRTSMALVLVGGAWSRAWQNFRLSDSGGERWGVLRHRVRR